MENAEIGKSELLSDGTILKDKGGPLPPRAEMPLVANDHGTANVPVTANQIPKIPVFMDEDEKFVDYRKPGFWAYTPAVFAFVFGLVLLVLFTAGALVIGFIIGAAIFAGMMLMVRRSWKKTGYWFTNHKLVIHDGSLIRLVPYDEIALSTLSFEGENCMFTTIYQHEVVLKGIIDMEQVVAFISKSVKAARKENGKAA